MEIVISPNGAKLKIFQIQKRQEKSNKPHH